MEKYNVFGVILAGIILARQLKNENNEVLLMDNDLQKQNKDYCGIKCKAPEANDGKYIIMVRTEYNQEKIKKQLLNLGISDSQIEIKTNDFQNELLERTDDKFYLECMGTLKLGYKMNLDNPVRFNEKLNWLKLYDRRPEHTIMVDKLLVKKYVSDMIGEKYVAKLIGVWDKFDDIDFAMLPERFVLKCTHDSGGVVVCPDKNKLDYDKAKKILNKNLSINFYYHSREWPYKDVKPRIIAEEFIESDNNNPLIPYKFMCFNGEPRIVQAIQNDKHINESVDYFNLQWDRLNIKQNYPNSQSPCLAPESIDEMISLAKILAKDEIFVRVDFFESNGHPFFSEYTFYSDAGFESFFPDSWDYTLGDYIHLKKDR